MLDAIAKCFLVREKRNLLNCVTVSFDFIFRKQFNYFFKDSSKTIL